MFKVPVPGPLDDQGGLTDVTGVQLYSKSFDFDF